MPLAWQILVEKHNFCITFDGAKPIIVVRAPRVVSMGIQSWFKTLSRNGNGSGLKWKKHFQTQTLEIFYILLY